MSASTNTGGGAGGGFTKATTETQIGDAETLLQKTPLPDADGVYNVLGRIGVSKKDAADEYAAIKRFEKSIRKAGGSIQQIVDHTDSESFSDLVGGLFSTGDLTLKDGASGLGLYADNPLIFDKTEFDISGISNPPGSVTEAVLVEVPGGDVHYIFDGGSSIEDRNLSQGTQTTVANTTAGYIDAVVDSSGDIHLAFTDTGNQTELTYIKKTSGTWGSIEDIGADFNEVPSIDVDQNDIPHVAFAGFNTETEYANRIGGSWSIEIVDGTDSPSATDIHVEDDSTIGIAYDDGATSRLATGSPGSFSTATYSSAILDSPNVDYDGSDWHLAGLNTSDVFVAVGTVGGGFSTISQATGGGTAQNGSRNLVAGIASGKFRLLVAGNSTGSDPYDALFFSNATGATTQFDEFGVVARLGSDWTSSKSSGFFGVSDNGAGDQTAISFNFSVRDIPATLKFNTGAQVTNADA